MIKPKWSFFLLLALALGSCGVPLEPSTELPPSAPQTAPTEPLREEQFDQSLEPTNMPSTQPVEKFVTLAKQDLASRLGVEANAITFVKSVEKLWLNAALGCPRPGVFYKAGRVPGFQIWLQANATEYVYNTDFQGTLIFCPELNSGVQNSSTDSTPGVPIR